MYIYAELLYSLLLLRPAVITVNVHKSYQTPSYGLIYIMLVGAINNTLRKCAQNINTSYVYV